VRKSIIIIRSKKKNDRHARPNPVEKEKKTYVRRKRALEGRPVSVHVFKLDCAKPAQGGHRGVGGLGRDEELFCFVLVFRAKGTSGRAVVSLFFFCATGARAHAIVTPCSYCIKAASRCAHVLGRKKGRSKKDRPARAARSHPRPWART
jgi:hypothetical protein